MILDKIKKISVKDAMLILMGIVLAAGFLFGAHTRSTYRKELRELRKEKMELQFKVDSIYSANRILDLEIEKYEVQVQKYEELIQKSNKELDKIQRKYEKILDSIGNYSISDLQRFFSDRYK